MLLGVSVWHQRSSNETRRKQLVNSVSGKLYWHCWECCGRCLISPDNPWVKQWKWSKDKSPNHKFPLNMSKRFSKGFSMCPGCHLLILGVDLKPFLVKYWSLIIIFYSVKAHLHILSYPFLVLRPSQNYSIIRWNGKHINMHIQTSCLCWPFFFFKSDFHWIHVTTWWNSTFLFYKVT